MLLLPVLYYMSLPSSGNGGVHGGLVCRPRAYQDQFRGFKSHRVDARRNIFLVKKLITGKRE